jgi:hypothetical protein
LRLAAGRWRLIANADVAQLAERVLGKDEVTSSILVIGSRFFACEVSEKFVAPDPRSGEGGVHREDTPRVEISTNGQADEREDVQRHG